MTAAVTAPSTCKPAHPASSTPARPVPGGPVSFRLTAGLRAPGEARVRVRRFVAACGGDADAAETAALAVSELVTNVLRHVPSEPGISVQLKAIPEGGVMIGVIDHSPEPPLIIPVDGRAESGRGLLMVEATAAELGWFRLPGGGKCVYVIVEKGKEKDS